MKTIMITEESLQAALKYAFETGYVEHMDIPFDNEFIRMAHEEASIKAHECKPFLDTLFSSLDDRAPAMVSVENKQDFYPLDPHTT